MSPFKADHTGNGIITTTTINTCKSKIHIYSIYIPFPNLSSTSNSLLAKVKNWLQSQMINQTPTEYILNYIKLQQCKSPIDIHVIAGDFNLLWTDSTLTAWAGCLNWTNPIHYYTHLTGSNPIYSKTTTNSARLIDHILINNTTATGYGSIPNNDLFHISDHNPIWIDISVASPGKPPGSKLTPIPAIKFPHKNESKIEEYQTLLSKKLQSIALPDTADTAVTYVHSITSFSVSITRKINNKKHSHKKKQREGWSPQMYYLTSKLYFLNVLRSQLQKHTQYHTQRVNKVLEDFIKDITVQLTIWIKKISSLTLLQTQSILPDSTDPQFWTQLLQSSQPYWQTDINSIQELLATHIKQTKHSLHAAERQNYHNRIYYYTTKQRQNYLNNKYGNIIRSIMGAKSDQIDLTYIETPTSILADPKDIHEYITAYAENYHSSSHPSGLETFPWYDAEHGSYDQFELLGKQLLPVSHHHTIPILWTGFQRPTNLNTTESLNLTIPSLSDFIAATNLHKESAPGISGLSHTMIKHWPQQIKESLYKALIILYETNTIPEQWTIRLACYIPKSSGPNTIDNLRPLCLLEIIRKMWINLLLQPTLQRLQDLNVLSINQHGYTRASGTTTATMALQNYKEAHPTFYLSSFDFTKAFDSISNSFIDLAYNRLNSSNKMHFWLTEPDRRGYAIVRTPFAQHLWEAQRYAGFTNPKHIFHINKGVGQGDIPSPHTWKIFMDILLKSLETIKDITIISYADDLITAANSLETLQLAADIISAFCTLTHLRLSTNKFRAFVRRPHFDNNFLRILNHDSSIITVQLSTHGHLKYLGAFHDISLDPNSHDGTQFDKCKQILTTHIDKLLTRKRLYSADILYMIHSYKTIPQLIYGLSLTRISPQMLSTLDKLQRQFYKQLTQNVKQFPTKLLTIPKELGGLNLLTISIAFIKSQNRILFSGLYHHTHYSSVRNILTRSITQSGYSMYISNDQGYKLNHHNNTTWLHTMLQFLHSYGLSLCKAGFPSNHGNHSLMHLRLTDATYAKLHKHHITTISDLIELNKSTNSLQWRLPKHINFNLVLRQLPNLHDIDCPSTLHPHQFWIYHGTIYQIVSIDEMTTTCQAYLVNSQFPEIGDVITPHNLTQFQTNHFTPSERLQVDLTSSIMTITDLYHTPSPLYYHDTFPSGYNNYTIT
eukprot:CAMPEP_0196768282 /NCGR_PEP_ID=MMETSP1095-20130614/42552_1 /TAXON_ID=96789 ORGANISM="Chromulina nebulosa, Strain UTEXLB2642" /NCGR_SAMPLE_ID=MMETSP1095 /ASSEMBLY_ACC=CAM_ASM_000446 /LENGTH=1175 /DNA_ID=CAMNT_0042137627 /DNA_START=713 /DNA_END=4241 /DNA_ORIENTATION=-